MWPCLAIDLLWCLIITTSQFAESTYQTPRDHSLQQFVAITEANKQVQEVANAKQQRRAAAYGIFIVKMREVVDKYGMVEAR